MCMKIDNKFIQSRTCTYNINYHFVWCTKYSRKVINKNVEERLNEILKGIANDKGFSITKTQIEDESCVHVFINAPPKLSATSIIRYLKGISGRLVLMEFPEIKEIILNGHLWNDSYLIETQGNEDIKTINDYIKKQNVNQP